MALSGDGTRVAINALVLTDGEHTNNYVLVYEYNEEFVVWEQVHNKIALTKFVPNPAQPIKNLALSENGQVFAFGDPAYDGHDGAAYAYEIGCGQTNSTTPEPTESPAHQPTHITITASEPTLSVVSTHDPSLTSTTSTSTTPGCHMQWVEPAVLEGFDEDAFMGAQIAMSDDGDIIAVHAPLDSVGNIDNIYSGHLQIYEHLAFDIWQPIGSISSLVSENGNGLGGAIALSADGSTSVALEDSRFVPVRTTRRGTNGYYQEPTRAAQFGSFNFSNADIFPYSSVSLSEHGNFMIVGLPQKGGGGEVQLYEWGSENERWQQRIHFQSSSSQNGDLMGFQVDVSNDATIIAISSPMSDSNGENSGRVRLYRKLDHYTFEQLGNDINGLYVNDQAGYSISLSSDGLTVAVGSPFNAVNGLDSGQVRVFRFDNATNTWAQVGNDLYGQGDSVRFGSSVALSGDGTRVAVSTQTSSLADQDTNYARVYEYIEETNVWSQVHNAIASNHYHSTYHSTITSVFKEVALSANGQIFALGDPAYDGEKGAAYVYKINDCG